MEDRFVALFALVAGAFSLAGAVFEWSFFMNHRKARLVQSVLGRTGARILYAVLGVGLIALGLAAASGRL